MDAARLRVLIDGALESQRISDAADAALESARTAANAARDARIKEAGNLKAAIGKGFVIYGDKVVRIGDNADGICVVASPLLSVPVVLPPPAPLPEPDQPAPRKGITPEGITPEDIAATALNKVPLSGGSVPAAKKPGGK